MNQYTKYLANTLKDIKISKEEKTKKTIIDWKVTKEK